VGYAWLFINFSGHVNSETGKLSFCFFKLITHLPCPACGSTRSVLSILGGEYLQACYLNPLGFVIVSIMIITPVWILYDYIKRKSSLLQFYQKAESKLIQKQIAVPAILMILANWFWNIYKGL